MVALISSPWAAIPARPVAPIALILAFSGAQIESNAAAYPLTELAYALFFEDPPPPQPAATVATKATRTNGTSTFFTTSPLLDFAGTLKEFQPPICDIERDARTNPGSLILCFSSLCWTAQRSRRSSSASEAPFRSGVFRSHSRREKRQVRSWPSAVRRMRSHAEQN